MYSTSACKAGRSARRSRCSMGSATAGYLFAIASTFLAGSWQVGRPTRRLPPATRHPPPTTRHPPPATRHPPPATRHPPPTTCHPPLVIHRLPTHRPLHHPLHQAAVKPSIQRHHLHPGILILQYMLGFAATSWLALLTDLQTPFVFTGVFRVLCVVLRVSGFVSTRASQSQHSLNAWMAPWRYGAMVPWCHGAMVRTQSL